MLTFQKFTGINNVVPSHRLTTDALVLAQNVDVGRDRELRRRQGYSEIVATCHKNLWQAYGFMLATVDGNDLVAVDSLGAHTTVQAALGTSRVWYCNLPDGRTTFSNGAINGVTAGGAATAWGVPIPASLGALTAVAGSLYPGDYQYQLTHVRLSDGLESAPLYSNPIAVATGGVVLTGLPTLSGHSLNVYLSSHNGDQGFLAGNTVTSAFSFTGSNDQLVVPCRTDFLYPAPVGTVTAFWRGRVLVASGPTLYASKQQQWEIFDLRRDFKQFAADITLLQPTDGGLYVGTTKELAFLAGTEFDKLVYQPVVNGRVVLGSGVAVRGELLPRGNGVGEGTAMLCIADRGIVAGFDDGNVVRMTEGRYVTDVTEVAATFRMSNNIPQYLAVPQ